MESGKIGLNQIEPRTVGGQPVELDAVWMGFAPFSHRFCLVRAEIIQYEMNPAMRPRWHHHFLEEIPAVFTGFPGCAPTSGHSRMGTKGRKELQRAVFTAVTTGAAGSLATPTFTSPRYSLQRPQFVKANHRAIIGRVSIQADYGVFFTSKSGSVLWHQV